MKGTKIERKDMTPEQIDGDTVDQRTDIYALGVTAYEMITGKKLLQKGNVASLMKQQRNGDIPNPADINPDLPESLCHFITKSGRRDPNKRYQSVHEATNDLLPLVKELGLSEN